jgi:23S rRNA (pseudouridine1915-N3)-methyltransferase
MILVVAVENHKNEEIDILCNDYLKRLQKFHPVKLELIPAARVKDPFQQKEKESAAIDKLLKPQDELILCDEQGKNYHSLEFTQTLEQRLSNARGRIILAIGGAYGFSEALLKKHIKIRLSDFTLPHHIARLVLIEQIYRSFTIIKGTAYHHA